MQISLRNLSPVATVLMQRCGTCTTDVLKVSMTYNNFTLTLALNI
jgi:hypothetical protein